MKPLLFLFALFFSAEITYARPIKVTSLSELDFGTGTPGDPSKQVSAGTSESSSNGSFQVSGDPNRAFSIVLPLTETLSTGRGPSSDTISFSNFESFPSGVGALNAAGTQDVFVGATRSALRLSQQAGLYSGKYSITVVY